jgi:hypothetical protein
MEFTVVVDPTPSSANCGGTASAHIELLGSAKACSQSDTPAFDVCGKKNLFLRGLVLAEVKLAADAATECNIPINWLDVSEMESKEWLSSSARIPVNSCWRPRARWDLRASMTFPFGLQVVLRTRHNVSFPQHKRDPAAQAKPSSCGEILAHSATRRLKSPSNPWAMPICSAQ